MGPFGKFAASSRRGNWLVPAYDIVLDSGYKDAHDDPQNFDIYRWAATLQALIQEIQELE